MDAGVAEGLSGMFASSSVASAAAKFPTVYATSLGQPAKSGMFKRPKPGKPAADESVHHPRKGARPVATGTDSGFRTVTNAKVCMWIFICSYILLGYVHGGLGEGRAIKQVEGAAALIFACTLTHSASPYCCILQLLDPTKIREVCALECCSSLCAQSFSYKEVHDLHMKNASMSMSEYLEYVFKLVKEAQTAGDFLLAGDGNKLVHLHPGKKNVRLCLRSFFAVYGIGSTAYYKMRRQVLEKLQFADTERIVREGRQSPVSDFVFDFLTQWFLDWADENASLGSYYERVVSFNASPEDIYMDLKHNWLEAYGPHKSPPDISLMRKILKKDFSRIKYPESSTLGHCAFCEELRSKKMYFNRTGDRRKMEEISKQIDAHRYHYKVRVIN